ncbi:NADH-quinone oxidoreductase subunit N [Thermovibrio ammonificans]|uniref:NADH-quinone oxidoreductase subunit N n=1 Tax=Thermovibrio ammonificans (strain DSM 15698 / JCM 12110 / HB-1) TaxID=648996 RepID=E8T4J1_THEA1|nr:NADH-quinone oxidoreductase subunit N [Thermovibrio ammonificans]ADU97449.1 NADH/Ubiquinone/plastoquinone (complex I) [Thermovibrio ammonificans HB-1]
MNINFLAAVMILALTGAFLPVINRVFRISGILGAIISSIGYVVSLFLVIISDQGRSILNSFFVTDDVSRLIGGMVLVASWMTMLVIYWITEKDKFVNELIGALMISTAGALLLISAENFVSLIIAMELMTMPTYLMVLFAFDDTSLEAGVKYFFNGALAVGFMLFGISLLYGMTGSFEFAALAKNLFKDPLVALAAVFIFAGFGFKLTAFPFHFWGPDVYDGTCPGVAALLTGISKSAAFIGLMRVIYEAIPVISKEFTLILAVIAAVTMTVGNLLALAQKRVSRILAFSSVAHAGYTLVAFAALSVPVSVTGILYHSVAYVFMKTAAFLCFAVFLFIWGARTMDDYKGLGRREPLLAALFLIFLLSLAGVPPMAGFISKVFVFTAAVDAGMTWLALIGLLNSAFSVAYYIWIAKQMYLEEPTLDKPINDSPKKNFVLIPLAVMAVLLIVLGIWLTPVLNASAVYAAKVGF